MTARTTQPTIDRIDPPCWFAGMRHTSLQLMVCGNYIATATAVTTDSSDVSVETIEHGHSPHCLFVYLDTSRAVPCLLKLTFWRGGDVVATTTFELKQREKGSRQRKGFSIEDVVYLVVPDRFASSGRMQRWQQGTLPKLEQSAIDRLAPFTVDRTMPDLRHGGDLEGLTSHLNYIKELGATTLWLTPVFENNVPDSPDGHSAYHGYAITDYYRVDPRLGSDSDYRRLVDTAHGMGLKVVMDMVFNHCSLHHPWFADPPMNDWFNKSEGGHLQTSYKLTPVLDPYAAEVDRRETVEGWFVPEMPDLNQRNPHLRRYLAQCSKWWIETAGIDGIRMDTYPYACREAMAEWMKEINEEYPGFNTVGETWVTEPAFTAAWQQKARLEHKNPDEMGKNKAKESHLKTVMDFSFFEKINMAKGEQTDDWFAGLNRVYHSICYDFLYADPAHVMAFIDNHDTDRFLGNGRDTARLKQALALLLTMKRIPQIYYGTEVLMNGTKAKTDGDIRRDFPGGFPGDERNCFCEEGRPRARQQMFAWLKRLLHFRLGNDIIAHGSQKHFIPHNGVYVLARQKEGRAVVAVLNGTDTPRKVSVERFREVMPPVAAKDVLAGHRYDLSRDFELKPRQTLLLQIDRP